MFGNSVSCPSLLIVPYVHGKQEVIGPGLIGPSRALAVEPLIELSQ